MSKCLTAGCSRPRRARGYCASHYTTERLKGTFATHVPSTEERFWGKVEKTETCWVWRSTVTRYGYGVFLVKGVRRAAHRVAYELVVGVIPTGLELDHRCHRPAECPGGHSCPHRRCVNPTHLEAVPGKVNLQRGGGVGARNAVKTHCPEGHEYTEENTYRDPKGKGRACLTCRRRVDRSKYVPRLTAVEHACGTCGAHFTFTREVGGSPRYCSDECRKAAGRRASREHARRRRAEIAT